MLEGNVWTKKINRQKLPVYSISAVFSVGEAKCFWWEIKEYLCAVRSEVLQRLYLLQDPLWLKSQGSAGVEVLGDWGWKKLAPTSHLQSAVIHICLWLNLNHVALFSCSYFTSFPRNERSFSTFLFYLTKNYCLCASFRPRPFLLMSPTTASLSWTKCCFCVCVCEYARLVQCAGREQLEHLQSSPLTAAQHMAGPCEGWVLSPGKVLTHRWERRTALTPWGRGGNSWTSAPHSFIHPA